MVPFSQSFINCRKEAARVWAVYIYYYRALDMDDARFQEIDAQVGLQEFAKKLHRRYCSVFGVENSTYNTHMAFTHLYEQRKANGPLQNTSTIKYESLYGLLGNLYRSGTTATGKQALTNFLLRDTMGKRHVCAHERKVR